jgi:Flp pilus assembly protein TadG
VCADRPARLWRDCGGATAAEFAMVLPVFVLLVMGMFQLAWAQHCASSLRAAMEQSSRALLFDSTLDQAHLQAMVQSKLAVGADPHVSVTLNIQTNADGSRVARLTGVYAHDIGIPSMATLPMNYQTTVVTALAPL